MGLYLPNGYVDIRWILAQGLTFNFLVGGRGTGKTYGALQLVVEDQIKFMFTRRTQSQIDIVTKNEFSPFKPINRDMGLEISAAKITKYNTGFYREDEGSPIGYASALSTMSNLRGFDASDVTLWIFDEFIPERHERPIKNEGAAFLNAYETINRNRELNGEKPMQVLCLANANDLGNPIFMELGLVSKAMKMQQSGKSVSLLRERGIGLYILSDSGISAQKAKTALYKAASKESRFSEMALNNAFREDDAAHVQSKPLKEYTPLVKVGEICIYSHKSDGTLYATFHTSGSPERYSGDEIDIKRFRLKYGWILRRYLTGELYCEDYFVKEYLTKQIIGI